MKTIMKTIVALLLVATFFLSSVPASVAAEETPVIKMLLWGDNNPPEENDVLSELEARLGVKLKVIYVTSDDYSAKLNSLIASNSLPDIFSVRDVKVLMELRDAGMLYNMESLLAEDGPDILAEVGENLYKPLVNKDVCIWACVRSRVISQKSCCKKRLAGKCGSGDAYRYRELI